MLRLEHWTDEELQRAAELARAAAAESWLRTAAGCYLIFVMPLVVFLPLRRAAETSNTWEVIAWCAAAGLGAVAGYQWRAMSKAQAFAKELAEEIESRKS